MKILHPQPNKQLALLLQEILDLPDRRSSTIILRAVLQAMKGALQNGEGVYVRGFGTFRIIERTHRPTPNNILANNPRGRPVAYSPVLSHYKSRRIVIFEPSIPLMAMLNPSSPNYKERRCQRLWTDAS